MTYAFDRAWSVKRKLGDHVAKSSLNMQWAGGTLYNYGELPPNYPVPAISNALDLIPHIPRPPWETFQWLAVRCETPARSYHRG